MILSLLVALAVAAPPSGIRRLSERHYKVPESARQRADANLNEVLQSARVVPALSDAGAFEGFRFVTVDKGSYLGELGFRKDDVITQVNDVVLDNAGKGLLAFQSLKNEKRWTVHLRRGKRKLKVRYDLVAK